MKAELSRRPRLLAGRKTGVFHGNQYSGPLSVLEEARLFMERHGNE